MRNLPLLVGLTVAPALLTGQQRALSKISVSVASCPLADSIQGQLVGKPRKVDALRRSDSQTILLDVSSDQVNQGLSSPQVRFMLNAGPAPTSVPPEGSLTLMIPGDAGRRIIATRQTPELTIELADSVTLRPAKVTLGTYDGPASFANAPLGTQLTPNSLLAIVRSDSLLIRAGLTYLRPSPSFRGKLRDAYRLALCGYTDSN